MAKKYPYSFTIEQLEDFITDNNVLESIYFELYDEDMDPEEFGADISADSMRELTDLAILFVKENPDYQIYTEVDLDTGEIGWSSGIRFVNRLDRYLAIKAKGYGPPDNS